MAVVKETDGFQKGIARQRSIRTPAQTNKRDLYCWAALRLSGFFHSENQTNELFGCMGNGNIVVFSLRSLLGKISGKGWILVTDILGGVVKGAA